MDPNSLARRYFAGANDSPSALALVRTLRSLSYRARRVALTPELRDALLAHPCPDVRAAIIAACAGPPWKVRE